MMSHVRFRNMFVSFVIFSVLWFVSPFVFASEVKIVFSGQSYAALYPCSCPHDPSGGVARRAALINKLRSDSSRVLVVEAGFSFASGPQDQYSQNYDMDSQRTDIYLKSLSLMNYDALLVSSQEYAFGVNFLESHSDLPLVSSNIEGFPLRNVIKDLDGVKVGILGLTDALTKAKGIKGWQVPATILEKRISELKEKGANIIILLSALTPQEDRELLKTIRGIDVVINGSPSFGSVNIEEIDGVVYLSTWWQARKVGILTLEISDSKITKKSLESIALDNTWTDDKAVSSLLPACFQDGDCQAVAGSIAKCESGATMEARCSYVRISKARLIIIRPKVCQTCRIEEFLAHLKKTFVDLEINYMDEDDPLAKEIIQEFKLTMLPAYVFDKDIENSEIFSTFSSSLDKGGNFYLFKPSLSGVSYFLDRPRIPKRLDVFFNFKSDQLPQLFSLLKTFGEKHKDMDVRINFLAIREKDGTLLSQGGISELEEFNRIACIDELYPQKLFDYLICRSSQQGSSWWDECAAQSKINASKVKECARSEKGRKAMAKRIDLTQELQIGSGPTFVVDNKEIFGIVNVPSIEEFEKTVLGQQDPVQTTNNKK